MKIYHYSPITGRYLGEGVADPCPVSGADLIPAFATATAPPAAGENQYAAWENGAWTVKDVPQPEPEPEPTQEEILANLIAAVQAHMDAKARERGYDNIFSACTYADEPTVPKFQAEGQEYRRWRSLVWAYCYAQLDAITAGTRPDIPTPESIVAEIQANVSLVLPE